MATQINLYSAVSEWVKGYTPLSNMWIYFNVPNLEYGKVNINSVSTSRVVSTDILGNSKIEFVFALDMIKTYDNGTNNNNLTAIQEVMNFAEWAVNNKQSLSFGDNKEIDKIECLSTVPNVTIDSNNNLAKYTINVRITYEERK